MYFDCNLGCSRGGFYASIIILHAETGLFRFLPYFDPLDQNCCAAVSRPLDQNCCASVSRVRGGKESRFFGMSVAERKTETNVESWTARPKERLFQATRRDTPQKIYYNRSKISKFAVSIIDVTNQYDDK